MPAKVLTYQIAELPDPQYARYKAKASGDVYSAVWADCEQLLRTLASFPSQSVTCEIRFRYRPEGAATDAQSRLRIELAVRASDETTAERVSSFVHHGPLSRFYDFQRVSATSKTQFNVRAVCDVIRRAQFVRPLYEAEFNANIPPCYYSIESFKANDKNNYLVLDNVLGNLDESVDIVMRFEPVDASDESFAHTQYLSELHSINRSSDRGDDFSTEIDYIGDKEPWRHSVRAALRPLRYRDPLADDILRTQQRFHETLHKPNVLFQIRVLAQSPAVAQLVGSTMAESAFTEGKYDLVTYNEGEELFTSVMHRSDDAHTMHLPVWNVKPEYTAEGGYARLARLSSMAPVEELCGAFRLPIASHASPCCIRKNTDPKHEKVDDLLLLGYDQEPSAGQSSGCRQGLPRGIRIDRLVKHLFLAGLPGEGKTTADMHMLLQLADRGIPFLVLETAKTEYRALKALRKHRNKTLRKFGQRLEVYTIGAESVSPFRYNPLELLAGISQDEKVETVLACFLAAMSLPGPALPLIAEALERVFAEYGDATQPPAMADLVGATNQVLEEKAYSGDTGSDIRAALEVRLGSLIRRIIGRVFQCRTSVPSIEHLMESCSVIELDKLPVEQSCLLSLFLLTAIREYVKTTAKPDRNPRFVIVIEEAHNIVGRSTDAHASEDIADPKSHAAEYVCRMLAELRALGVAIVIVDQLPSAVAPEVIKNTASKLTFREVANDDRADLGGTMLFTETEFEEIARLETGEAFFSTVGYHGSRRIQTVNLHDELALPSAIQDQELVALLRDDPWFVANANLRVNTQVGQLADCINAFDRVRLHATKRLAALSTHQARLLATKGDAGRRERLVRLVRSAQALRQELRMALRCFLQGPYRMLQSSCTPVEIIEDSLVLQTALVRRFENVIQPGTQACIDRIDALIARSRVLIDEGE